MKLIKENKERLNEAQTLNLRRNGFVIAPEENFSDDGNYFKGYYYDPEHTGDKRFRTSKLISDGQAYISVRYFDDIKGKTVYFDDLNGVDYEYAINHIKDLTDKIDEFKAKLDAGEIQPKELSEEEIELIKNKTKQLVELSDMSWSNALDTVVKKAGFDLYDLRKDVRDRILKEIESEIRNAKEDNPALVKALAKKMLENTMKLVKGDEGHWDSRGRWQRGDAPKSLDDALKSYVSVSTYGSDAKKHFGVEPEELESIGLKKDELYTINDLTDANQERIRNWVRNKIENLYDFE